MCVCVCVTSSRWQRGGHEVAGENSNFGGIHVKVAHFLQMEGAVRVRGMHRASNTAPHRRWVPLLSWVRPQYHQDQQFFCLVGPPLVCTTPTTTPPEVPRAGSRTGPPLQSLVATVAGRPGAPRRPVLQPWRPAAAHSRVFRRGPGQPTLMTVFWPTKQDPGSSLGPTLRPLWAR